VEVDRLAAVFVDLLRDLVRRRLIDVADGDLGALAGELDGGRLADARACPGDDRDFVDETHAFGPN